MSIKYAIKLAHHVNLTSIEYLEHSEETTEKENSKIKRWNVGKKKVAKDDAIASSWEESIFTWHTKNTVNWINTKQQQRKPESMHTCVLCNNNNIIDI